jgi:large subunit ribosomal protein L18e
MSKVRKLQRRKTDPNLAKLIDTLLSKEKALWKDVAKRLAKPRRLYAQVNVSKIERYLLDGEIAVVPGKVLGSGELSKPIKVAALSFSENAKRKIEEAGGKCITLEEAAEMDGNFRIIR